MLAGIMNEFFVSKVRNLRENLPNIPGNPLPKVSSLMQDRSCSFNFRPVSPDEVSEIISNLKSSRSCGIDDIDTYVIKLARDELVPVLTHIINRLFPSYWKLAKVIPLHKKDEVTNPKNYRPVALLSIASKILERTVFAQLIEYFENNNLLHPSHHGFRGKHNTSTALLQMFDVWLEALENKEISAAIMLDMSAAFDVVDHDILIEKLKLYGVDSSSSEWIKSYLTSRSQKVYIDGAYSGVLDLEAGVPQGSVLGPLLYVIFTNDLPESVHDHLSESGAFFNTHCKSCGDICCYVDDSTFTTSGTNPEEIMKTIEVKYKAIKSYMTDNKLVLNTDKTHLLIMATPYQHRMYNNFGISLNTGTEIIEL